MECTLVHDDIPVLDIIISEYSGNIEKIGKVHNIEHLPIGAATRSKDGTGVITPFKLNRWWTERSIPSSRDGIDDALLTLGVHSVVPLLPKCHGLSLSDQYWICPKGSGLNKEAINFFQEDFSSDVGEILFGQKPADIQKVNLVSPDITTDGWLRKKWIISDTKRILVKGGSGVYQQEPFNEVIASIIMKRLHIPHVEYSLIFDDGKPYSMCENFITYETELVPAWHVKEILKKDNKENDYTHFLRCCDESGITDVKASLSKMLVLDFLISNEDRHYNNFGFIRDAKTLEWIGFAPIFDSGTSLWYNTQHAGSSVQSKPFRKNHNEQIKLVEDFSWFNSEALSGVQEEIMEILNKSKHVDSNRQERIVSAIGNRIKQVETLARKQK